MTRRAFSLALAAAAAPLRLGAAEAESFRPLFDGSSLDGWRRRSGRAEFRIEDASIVGRTVEGSANTFLCPPGIYGDFILEYETKTDPRLNSGVQIRAHSYERETVVYTYNRGLRKRTRPAGRVYGYQVETSTEERGNSGGIFDEARRGWLDNPAEDPAASKAFRDNRWNRYRVVARGDSIKTWVNGVPCADLVDSMDLEGFFGLQVHNYRGEEPLEVRWRNLRLADLGRHLWKPLFDGRSLAGWNPRGGGSWAVEDGAIRARAAAGSKPALLLSEARFSDFTVRFEYKAVAGNSGFFFRAPDGVENFEGMLGYEVEIDAEKNPGRLQEPGGRWKLAEPDAELLGVYHKPGEWNELTVSAHAGRVVVHLNGMKCADLRDDPGRREGRLAFQMWPPKKDVEVLFRKIVILEKA